MSKATTHKQSKDTYLVGYGDAARAWIEYRTAESHAAFFTPYLKTGMRLLDMGCGPGGITVGLAKKVAPARVTACDIEQTQLDRAQERAAEAGVTNIDFQIANVFGLPFDDNSFDAIFMSAVLSNLQRPDEAVREIARVLKPGGIAGFNEFDSGGDIYYPLDPLIQRSADLYFKLREHVGDDPRGGRRLKAQLLRADLDCIHMHAIYESIDPSHYANAASLQFKDDMGPQMKALGWTDDAEIEAIGAAWKKLAEDPSAYVAATWVQAIGRKPDPT